MLGYYCLPFAVNQGPLGSEAIDSKITTGLCSSRAQWPLAPNYCSRAIRKSFFFSNKSYAGHPRFYSFGALGSLQFSLEHSLVTSFSEMKKQRTCSRLLQSITTAWPSGSRVSDLESWHGESYNYYDRPLLTVSFRLLTNRPRKW